MLERGLVHFVATDAHSPKARRPLISRAFERVAELTDESSAIEFCCRNPAAVVAGKSVQGGRRTVKKKANWGGWLNWRRAA
jgi:protein-tyrosine phosphatase